MLELEGLEGVDDRWKRVVEMGRWMRMGKARAVACCWAGDCVDRINARLAPATVLRDDTMFAESLELAACVGGVEES